MNEPKLRFKADDGSQFPDWEEKKLSDIFVERREMQCIDDEYKLLSFTIEQGVINPEDKKTNKRDFLMKDKVSKKFLRTEYDDIIYNPANLKYGAINRNKLGKGLLSPIYAIFYTEQNAVFMESVVRNPDFIKRSLKYLEGTVIKLMTLKPRDFLRIKSYIPSLPEQQKIADFLSTIDTIIEKQQATVSAWEERKKGVMQKLFSQEVRFKADDGSDFPDWEEKKIASLGDMVGGGTPTTKKKEYWHGKTAWISSADVEENDIYNINMTRFITQEAIDNSATKIIPKNSILIVSRVGVGKVAKAPCDLCTSQDFTNIVDVKGDSTFLTYAVLRLMQSKLQCVQGTSIKGIPSDEIRNYIMNVPSLPEQQKIADCLSALDTVIQKQKETLERWQELKKGLLQQMFV